MQSGRVFRQSLTQSLIQSPSILAWHISQCIANLLLSEGDLLTSTPKRSASISAISRFLNTPLPPCKIPSAKHGKSGKVLTSQENREAIQKKKDAKEKEAREKEERKAAREAKALAKKLAKGDASKMEPHCVLI